MIFIKNILKICFVIIGTIIGAGFASGKEIYTFFCIHGIYGLIGIFISNLIIGLIIFLVFSIIKKNNIKTYSKFVNNLVGQNKLINYAINNIMNIFLLISFIVMISGFGAYFKQEFNISAIFGTILICIFASITFYKNINGIIKINSFLIPCLISLILLLGLKANIITFNPNSLIIYSNKSWIIQSILYASYNSIILIPIIINLNTLIINKKQITLITFLTFIFMCIMSVTIYIVLCINMPVVNFIDIPILYIANSFRHSI